LELGQPRNRRADIPESGRWDGDADGEQRPPQAKLQSAEREYGNVPTPEEPHRFEEDTNYPR
jgi:hypothetical protein